MTGLTYLGLFSLIPLMGVALAGALIGPLLTCCLCGGGYFLMVMTAMGKSGLGR